jgi:purine-binding chemotaxis protein CheW
VVLDPALNSEASIPGPDDASATPRVELLVLLLGGERYALPIEQVSGVDERRAITPLPGTPSGVLGVFNRLGDVVPALDLSLLLHGRDTPPRGGYLAVGQTASGPLALLVDEVEAVVAVDPVAIEPPLPTLGATRLRLVRGQVQVGEHWVTLLDLEGIVATITTQAQAARG